MQFTERELRLILLALDNTSSQLHLENEDPERWGGDGNEADEMDALYCKVLGEIVIMEGSNA